MNTQDSSDMDNSYRADKLTATIAHKPQTPRQYYSAPVKDISFPSDEISTLQQQDKIVTTRVSKDFSTYGRGDIVRTPWGAHFLVVDRLQLPKLEDHPFYSQLTEPQIKFLSSYSKIAVLTLSRIPQQDLPVVRKTEQDQSQRQYQSRLRDMFRFPYA